MKRILFFATMLFLVLGQKDNMELMQRLVPHETLVFFVKFLRIFQNYHVIFHADYKSMPFVEDTLYLLNKDKTVASVELYNYDTIENEFLRPSGSFIVNVLLSERSQFWSTFNSISKLNENDVFIFVVWSSDFQEKIKTEAYDILRLAGNILIVELSKEIGAEHSIYRTCFYCGYLSEQFQLILKTNTTEMTIELSKLLPTDLRDLNGHVFNIVYLSYFPFIYCETGKLQQTEYKGVKQAMCSLIKGIESQLLETVSKKSNFSYVVHTLDSNSTFFDLIMHVHAKKADIAIGGISMTQDRIPFVEFSKQFNAEDNVLLYVLKLTFREIFQKYAEQYQYVVVWLLYLGAFSIFFFLHYFIEIENDREQHNSIKYVIWMFFHTPFEQGVPGLRYIFTIKPSIIMILAVWWGSAIILCTTYKTNMLSTMVKPLNTEPDDLEQLVKDGFLFVVNEQYKDVARDLLDVKNDPVFLEALAKTFYVKDACTAMKTIEQGGIAMLSEFSELQYDLQTVCPKPDPELKSAFRIARKIVRSTGHGWAFQIGVPFRPVLEYFLSLISSGGLFKKWIRDETSKLDSSLIPKSREVNSNEVNSLSLKRITPIFVAYAIGIGLGFISFIAELFIYKLKKNQTTYYV